MLKFPMLLSLTIKRKEEVITLERTKRDKLLLVGELRRDRLG